VAAVQRHRGEVPEAFRAQIDLASHQKAADYTVASARIKLPRTFSSCGNTDAGSS
jgi:STE24 endopeptidase